MKYRGDIEEMNQTRSRDSYLLRTAVTVLAGLIYCHPALSQDLNGWCFPANACMGEPSPIVNYKYDTCEDTCELTNPVKIEGMKATAYTEICKGDGGRRPTDEKVLIAQTIVRGNPTYLYVTDYLVIQLKRCKS